MPYLVPVWYEWDWQRHMDNHKPRAEYVKNLKKNAYAAVSIATSKLPYVRVLIQGRAELIETDQDWLPDGVSDGRLIPREEGRPSLHREDERLETFVHQAEADPNPVVGRRRERPCSGQKKYIQSVPGPPSGVAPRVVAAL